MSYPQGPDRTGPASLVAELSALVQRKDFTGALRLTEALTPPDLGDDPHMSAQFWHMAARARLGLGDHAEALRAIRRAQGILAPLGDQPALAELYYSLGETCRQTADLKEAEQAFRDAESIFRRADDREGQCRALNQLAGLAFRQQEYRASLALLLDTLKLAHEIGDRKKTAYLMGNIGRVYLFLGELDEAQKHLRINIELSNELGDRLETARARLSLAYAHLQRGEHEACEQLLDEAYPDIIATASRQDEAIHATYLGELYYRTGRLGESRRALDRALEIAEHLAPNSTLAARAMRHMAELAYRQGNERQVQRWLKAARPIFEHAHDRVELGALIRLEAEMVARSSQQPSARALYRRALELLAATGVVWEQAETLALIGVSPAFTNREQIVHLARAEELYARLNNLTAIAHVSHLLQRLESPSAPNADTVVVRSSPAVDYVTVNATVEQYKSQLQLLAKSDLVLMITGETGVGKDRFARFYHSVVRPTGPFVAVNCASLPETLLESELFGYRRGAFTGAVDHKQGLFVAANGGVLLLDEIGDLPLSLQAKLLGVLERRAVMPLGETREVPLDVKLVAATNRDLEQMVAQGSFRRDLYYRISGLAIHLPPLRERREDIPVLMHHFMTGRGLIGPSDKVPSELVRQFLSYDWPGNIRELDNRIRRLEIMVQMASAGDLVELSRSLFGSTPTHASANLFDRVEEFERQLLLEALRAAKGNKSEAARMLGVHEATVRVKLKRYGVKGSIAP